MTCKFCDGCGQQLPVKDGYADRMQRYSVKMFVPEDFGNGIDHERFLKFCPECRQKVEEFLDEIQRGRPETVSAVLMEE